MSVDERRLGELVEESQDLQSDALRGARPALDEMVDLAHERGRHDVDESRRFAEDRRSLISRGVMGGGALAAAGFGGALLTLMARPAFADQSMDVQMLQTAASIENLAVATYATARTLPFASSLPQVVQTFVTTTKAQHTDHGKAFNAAVTQLGGKAQDQPDPVLLAVVNKAKPTLTGPGPLVDLAIQLETGAAETYVADVGEYSDTNARKVTASIMGVEAQHVAVLNAVKALVAAGHPEWITLPPPIAQLPAAAGSVGFPDTFIKTDQARPASEGAVK